MRYAKLNDGSIAYAPNPITVDGNRYGNPPAEILRAEGYKSIQYADQPEPQGAGRWEETWTETDEVIIRGWVWHEAGPDDEISGDEVLDVLFGGDPA